MTREQEILNHMKILSISREEAEQLYEDDHSNTVLPEVAELEKKDKASKRRYFQGDKERKSTTRKKEADPEKVALVKLLNWCLLEPSSIDNDWSCDIENVAILSEQKEISFRIGENDYSVTLTKHRKKDPKN